jgi:very-short-patch-repair endonuclease
MPKGIATAGCFKKGHNTWNKGTHGQMPAPWNKGLSTDNARIQHSTRGLKRYAQSQKGRDTTSKHMKSAMRSFWDNMTPEEKEQFIERRTKRIRETRSHPDACAKQQASMRRTHALHPEWSAKSGELTRIKWSDPEKKATWVMAIMRGSRSSSPNKSELQLQSVIDDACPNSFAYNGDGRLGVILGGLVPDFVNINGKKLVIELFGEYWHRTQDRGIQVRIDKLAKLGWKCLIIWDKELKDIASVRQRIIKFIDAEVT